MDNNLQTILWAASGPLFWAGMSLIAGINVAFLFAILLSHHERNALTYARLMWLGGCILAVFIPMNSGMQIWSLAVIVTSGAWMSALLVTNWCCRPGTPWNKVLAIAREIIWGARQRPHKNGAD